VAKCASEYGLVVTVQTDLLFDLPSIENLGSSIGLPSCHLFSFGVPLNCDV